MKSLIDKQQEKNVTRPCHSTSWFSAPSELHLTRDEVHVWCVNLNISEPDVNYLKIELSIDEKAKANKFHFKNDRDKYISRHVVLRKILGRYFLLESDKMQFNYGPYGKPTLFNGSKRDKIHFNLSHSKGLVLYAMTRGRELGIDVEKITPGIMDEPFISFAYSQKELSTIQSLPPELRQFKLFTSWTRKEAFAKALGHGLNFDFKQIDVSRELFEKSPILNNNSDANNNCCWSLRNLELGSNYAGSIVVEGYNWSLKCWKWECNS